MRIIGGDFGGRKIKVPSDKFTRPTTDRVRETIFNILNNLIDFENTIVLDLYAGSGSFGLECLSRGSKEAHFVEKNFQPCQILKENILSLNVQEQTKIFKLDAAAFTKREPIEKYDLIFADPPFFKYDIYDVFKNIVSNEYLVDGGIFIIERSIQTLKEDSEAFGISPFKTIGDAVLYKYQK